MATQMIQHGRVTWTNIERVTPDDIRLLTEAYPHFHPLDLEDLQSRIERPKIDEYDDYLFVVMQFPLWDPVQRVSRAAEVDMFVGSGYLVTASDGSRCTVSSPWSTSRRGGRLIASVRAPSVRKMPPVPTVSGAV